MAVRAVRCLILMTYWMIKNIRWLPACKKYHVHFLVQSVPSISVSGIACKLKSITTKKLFQRHSDIRVKVWRGNFWRSGYYANTVGRYANEEVI